MPLRATTFELNGFKVGIGIFHKRKCTLSTLAEPTPICNQKCRRDCVCSPLLTYNMNNRLKKFHMSRVKILTHCNGWLDKTRCLRQVVQVHVHLSASTYDGGFKTYKRAGIRFCLVQLASFSSTRILR